MSIVMWFSGMYDKTINIKSKSKYTYSKSHKHRDKLSVVAKENEFITPDINRIDYIINNYGRDCFNKFFHALEIRCIYDIEMTKGDFVTGVNSDENFK